MIKTYSFDNAWERARARLKGLEARFDPGTVSHLEMLGVGEGLRCLELGAGAGSVAHWLGERVGRTWPRDRRYWDGNWVTSTVEIAAGPWKGAYRASFRTNELAGFRDQLQRLYDDKEAGPATFESMEPQLRMKAERSDRLGHVSVTGEAQPSFDKHNVLHFALELDQSYLPAAIEGLASILKNFPVIGSPTAKR